MRIDSKFEIILKKHLNVDRKLSLRSKQFEAEAKNINSSFIKNDSSALPSYMSTYRTEGRSKDESVVADKKDEKKLKI